MSKFFDSAFDDATQLKLMLFRNYIREWIPVFLIQSPQSNKNLTKVEIFDFFSGPGKSSDGTKGSPLIIAEELVKFLQKFPNNSNTQLDIFLYFNDKTKSHTKQLKEEFLNTPLPDNVKTQFNSDTFYDAFEKEIGRIESNDSASLVLMDQFGVKAVTQKVFHRLIECPKTDILFFISSSTVNRFISDPCIQQIFSFDPIKLQDVEYNGIHRFIKEYYQSLIPQGTKYYLVPFSIKKGKNIYGVIFGSKNLLGVEKFLKCAWEIDSDTGQANYNIDNDLVRNGQPSLFDDIKPYKKDVFEHELKEFLKTGKANNLSIYEFTLEKGFLPKHCTEILKNLQDKQKLDVVDSQNISLRKNSFYINYDHYKKNQLKAWYKPIGEL